MLSVNCSVDRHEIGICQTDLPVAGHGRARENRPIPVTGRSIGASLTGSVEDCNSNSPVRFKLEDMMDQYTKAVFRQNGEKHGLLIHFNEAAALPPTQRTGKKAEPG